MACLIVRQKTREYFDQIFTRNDFSYLLPFCSYRTREQNFYVENSLLFISSVYENGFDFIYEQIGGDTYYVRFYGIALSILGFIEYPLGVGYGGHVYIFETILSNIFFDAEMPHEIKTYLDSYITLLSPKSNFFLFLISFGVFFLIFIYKLTRFFFKTRKLNNSLYNAFLITLIMSVFAEMNPMLLYFAILYGLQQNTNFKTHKNISH